jgi:ankyrin repeat protein
MARETFIDNPVEEDKNCSIHNIFTLLQNEEEEEELDVVLASTDSTAGGGAVHHADYADVAELLQWLRDNTGRSWDDINATDYFGRSALHIACQKKAPLEVISGLLDKLDEKPYRCNALHVACEYGPSWEVINWLLGKLEEEAINAIDKFGRSALHVECSRNASLEVINGLLGKLDEEAINAIDKNGRSALHNACSRNASLEVINGLLGKLDEEAINAIDKDGRSALHNACSKNGRSALHYALWKKASLEVINGLLGRLDGKVINSIGNDGSTALHIACVHGASEVINAIMTHKNGKEQVSIKDVTGKLPFDDIFPDDKGERDEQLKKLLKLHDFMEANDPTASSYPNGLLQSILNLPSEDRDEFEFMNHSYFRKTINAKIIKPFSLSILFLDVAVQGLVMAVFSFTINGAVKKLPTTSMAGLIPCLLWLLFRELVQLSSATAKFYFGDAANFVDLIQIVLVGTVLLISFIGKASIDEGLLVACIAVAWTRLIFVISNLHYSLALFVAALLQVSSSWYIEFTILAMMQYFFVFR